MNRKYFEKKYKNPLPKLKEEERIYLKVNYTAREFAKYCHCGFDDEKKLWFTGDKNANLYALVNLYGVDEHTSKRALKLLEKALE